LKDAKNQAKELRKIASKAIEEVSRLARGLHSSVLDQFGLKEAIEKVAKEHSSLHSTPVNLDFGKTPFAELNTQLQIGIYRIIQEALTNIARHSRATSVSVRFEWSDPLLKLFIRDDGQGFRSRNLSELPSKHLGIEGMRQRAIILGGALDIKSEPNKGTLIEVRLPVARSQGANSGAAGSL
jgi:signal transduction histidine kinase